MPPRRRTVAAPYGRDEVMTSLMDAARDLFAKRGPASVTVRDIAARARVSHGLIYRHFGTKDALLKAVMRREAMAFSTAAGDPKNPVASVQRLFEENIRRERFIRILAFALLSRTRMEDLYSEEGALGILLTGVREESQPKAKSAPVTGIDPRISVAAASAFMKGWLLFEPWVLQAVGAVGEDVNVIRKDIGRLLEQVISSGAPAPAPRSDPKT
ncbi:helix-turn-helix domain-containing protein [Streptomyces sp. DSM 41524]|uniref:Helix-turn-helix domain-containing protein n=2 Tax=Streptomyces asiaticus TaxID=114695 RepID=A0ABU7QE85_9ACTN|nr:helix-turn-helix domain-containing protein [Streptomyces sp. DSM 41524]